MSGPAVEVRGLTFRYRGSDRPVLRDVTLALQPGERTLLIGANGAGKTTLLEILAGRHMIPPEVVRMLGRPAFHDTALVERVAYVGGSFPFDVDIAVAEILARQAGVARERQERLLEVLGVDPGWRMHRVSNGQRRRVQILLSLLRPSEVLLLDEVTTDLDVVARADLLRFLERESRDRGAAILYATHILDGLDGWATHLVLLDAGRVRLHAPLEAIRELRDLREAGTPSPLLRVVERWLRDAR